MGVFSSVSFASDVIDKEAVELVSLDTDIEIGVTSNINLEFEDSATYKVENLYSYDIKDYVSLRTQSKRMDRFINEKTIHNNFYFKNSMLINLKKNIEPPLYILRS